MLALSGSRGAVDGDTGLIATVRVVFILKT